MTKFMYEGDGSAGKKGVYLVLSIRTEAHQPAWWLPGLSSLLLTQGA